MILAKLIPAALANHLWQSTLFAAAAALLALALRKNRAQTRYTLWLIASLKFLVPFALLIAAGAHLRWPAAAPIATPTFSVAVQQIGQPFTAREISTSVLMPAVSNAWNPVITILFSIWFVGFAAVLLSWWRRWMRIRTIVRAASPLPLETSVPVLSSPTLLEPGVFGIFRPVLLLPEGITGHLSARHLESIFAHELCHVRRRDNLAAAIHMFVEALFWFHPLVWWIGARMMEERERACDEEVLRLGNQPQVYAESILKACQFYLESPLACISG
ncbi:MAG TPA: M56 family metallopeptidase, partial [Bryobacteraceae bacterium]|nr:M56 family metallopeptidase [Bryobacteraceae bacterium]